MPPLPMTESELSECVRSLARTLGLRIYHTYDSRRSYSGFPDLVLVGRGGHVFRELKATAGDYPTPEQQAWLDALTAAGADTGVWRPSDWHSGRIAGELDRLRRPPGFTCPRCGKTSYHPEDLRHGYCGACHAFTGLGDNFHDVLATAFETDGTGCEHGDEACSDCLATIALRTLREGRAL